MNSFKDFADFYKGKNVFVTGHTGFKGAWLSVLLGMLGSRVTGYALEPEPVSLYNLLGAEAAVVNNFIDIRDFCSLKREFDKARPDIVFHMAAQPLVKESYINPSYTYEVNVMGTVNILECVRNSPNVKSFLNITTDKVYLNNEWCWGYRENDALDGFDPYSNSKSCSELVTASYKRSFFSGGHVSVSTARAGNVIGGGDFAVDRILPDCVRAATSNKKIMVRNPYSIRPYQHVLESLSAYLLIAQKQFENPKYADSYNVGANDSDCVATETIARMFCDSWGGGVRYEYAAEQGPHEAGFLKLDITKIKTLLGWHPRWNIKTAVKKTVEWNKNLGGKHSAGDITKKQINEYFEL